MVTTMMMEEIMHLKRAGYTQQEVKAYFERKGEKAPSMPTLRKYYQMGTMPTDPHGVFKKERAFDNTPFREVIMAILENKKGQCCISSVYDMLTERFVESGEYEKLPGNEQTLRNYVRHLIATNAIDIETKNGRIYDHVFDTPPGEQMLIDFGEVRLAGGKQVHFICLLLRYSRKICVYAQDHKYNAEEACRDIYRAIQNINGRPKQFVIDQDAVFIASENYGEIVETRVFKDFCTEQDIRLWVCNKADPESKGGVENLVGFVKKNYFSARTITGIEDVWESLSRWVVRKNRRIHQATYSVPDDIFGTIEQAALRPLIPSVYENTPSSYTRVSVGSMPYVLYKSVRYSVPREYCFKTVCYKAAGGKLHLYDESRRYLCTHTLSERKGAFIQMEAHKKEPSTDWIPIVERLREKWNCADFQHFINGFKKENPRHLYHQLKSLEGFLDAESPTKECVALVINRCCMGYRYQFGQFKQVYYLAKGGVATPAAAAIAGVQQQALDVYQRAFEERCEQ